MAINPPQPPQAPVAPSSDSISCYRTIVSLGSQAQSIARALLAIGRASSDAQFWVTPNQRGFGYFDAGAMFQADSAGGALPSSADEAEAQARSAIQRINTGLGKDGTLSALKISTLLPPDLQRLNIAAVYHPTELTVDHWLCRFIPMLASRSAPTPSLVSEATVEVRIGRDGRMLGLTAQWSPVDQEMLCIPIAAPDPRQLPWTAQADEQAAVESTDAVDATMVQLTYVQVSAASGEAWLLPCYIFEADPLQRRYPAARHRMNELLQTTSTT